MQCGLDQRRVSKRLAGACKYVKVEVLNALCGQKNDVARGTRTIGLSRENKDTMKQMEEATGMEDVIRWTGVTIESFEVCAARRLTLELWFSTNPSTSACRNFAFQVFDVPLVKGVAVDLPGAMLFARGPSCLYLGLIRGRRRLLAMTIQ